MKDTPLCRRHEKERQDSCKDIRVGGNQAEKQRARNIDADGISADIDGSLFFKDEAEKNRRDIQEKTEKAEEKLRVTSAEQSQYKFNHVAGLCVSKISAAGEQGVSTKKSADDAHQAVQIQFFCLYTHLNHLFTREAGEIPVSGFDTP